VAGLPLPLLLLVVALAAAAADMEAAVATARLAVAVATEITTQVSDNTKSLGNIKLFNAFTRVKMHYIALQLAQLLQCL